MNKLILEEIQRMNLLSRYDSSKTLSEQTIPGGISRQAFDKIMAISATNKKGFRGSYLFPIQWLEINKEFGADTYGKFFRTGGDQMLMKPETAPLATASTTTDVNSQESLDYYRGEADKAFAKYKTVTPKTAVVIPPELNNKEAIIAFQVWLDNNHGDDKEGGKGKGWATGYKDGKVSGGIGASGFKSGGYGIYGPRTIAAWGKYKTAYLTSVTKPEPEKFGGAGGSW